MGQAHRRQAVNALGDISPLGGSIGFLNINVGLPNEPRLVTSTRGSTDAGGKGSRARWMPQLPHGHRDEEVAIEKTGFRSLWMDRTVCAFLRMATDLRAGVRSS